MAQVADGHEALAHAEHGPGDHDHPGELTYIKIAAMLAMITIIEVVIYYIQWFHDSGALVPSLLVLSAIKFYTVVSFFMHLKFDSKLLSYTFIVGLLFGGGLIVSFIALFDYHTFDYALDFVRNVTPDIGES